MQLTPEQEKLWPPVEEAIRARAEARQERSVSGVRSILFELMRGRADALAQRAANLKKLADAWAPLYQTLNPDQKERMRLLVTRVLHDLKVGAETRGMEMYDEDR